jgi:hypothetical protein
MDDSHLRITNELEINLHLRCAKGDMPYNLE